MNATLALLAAGLAVGAVGSLGLRYKIDGIAYRSRQGQNLASMR